MNELLPSFLLYSNSSSLNLNLDTYSLKGLSTYHNHTSISPTYTQNYSKHLLKVENWNFEVARTSIPISYFTFPASQDYPKTKLNPSNGNGKSVFCKWIFLPTHYSTNKTTKNHSGRRSLDTVSCGIFTLKQFVISTNVV